MLAELVPGADATTVAARLVISEHTVNDHVKAILAMTGGRVHPPWLVAASLELDRLIADQDPYSAAVNAGQD